MVNVPPDATEREIVFLFKSCGTVEKVYFDADGPGEPSDDESDADSAECDTASLSHQSHAREITQDSCKKYGFRIKRSIARPAAQSRTSPHCPTSHTSADWPDGPCHIPRCVVVHSCAPTRAGSSGSQTRFMAHERRRGTSARTRTLHQAYESARPSLDAVRAYADSAIARLDFDLAGWKAALRRESKYKKAKPLWMKMDCSSRTWGSVWPSCQGRCWGREPEIYG